MTRPRVRSRAGLWWTRAMFALLVVLIGESAAIAQRPGADTLAEARALAHQGRLDEALAVYTRLLDATPGALDVRTERARVLGWLGRHAEALVEYERVLAVTPRDIDGQLGRGRVLGWMGRVKEAEAALRQAITDNPDVAGAHTAFGDILSRQRRYPEAASAYARARSLAPADPSPIEGLARVYLAQGDAARSRATYEEALFAYARLSEASPDDTDARLGQARALVRLGRETEALAEYERVLAARPGDVDGRIGRGRALSILGRLPEAEAELHRAVLAAPRSAEALTALAGVLSRRQRLDEAARAYGDARALAPDSVEPVLGLARIMLWRDNLPGATAGYEEALRLDPGNEDALEALDRIARTPTPRRFRLDLGYRYEVLSDRSDWEQETAVLVVRPRKGTVLFAGVDQYHRNDRDDTHATVGGGQALPADLTLAGSLTYGPDAEVVARQIYEAEVSQRLTAWATPTLRYRRSNFPGEVHADALSPGIELTWAPYLSVLARYYFVRASDAGDGHAGSGRLTLFPEGRVSAHVGAAYGRETYLAGTLEQVVRGIDVLTLSAGLSWRVSDWMGLRLDYVYEDRRGSYVKHGVGFGVFLEF